MENSGINIERRDTKDHNKNGWYATVEIVINKKTTLSFHGMVSGCGTVEMQGNKYLDSLNCEEITFLADYLKNKLTLENGYTSFVPGLIIAIHGQSTSSEEQLKALGFEVLSEHLNWQDGREGIYKQKLYGLKTNYKGKENI